jgi:hypothetical protein
MLQLSGHEDKRGMGARSRHSRLFRQYFPRLDDRQYPHGHGDFKEVAEGRIRVSKRTLPY